ncbi:hypothetical protein R3I94_008827 [Phoxinus phoxinus]
MEILLCRDYRLQPEATIQVTKISKLILALEKGKLTELKGKYLDEIQDFTEKDDDQNIDSNEDSIGAIPLELNSISNGICY